MKCSNPRVDDDAILFDCPFCGMDAEVDELTLMALWAQDGEGNISCPPPEGCGKEYTAPTLQEVAALKANAELAGDATPAAEPSSEEPPPSTLDTTGQAEPPSSTAQSESTVAPPSTTDLEKKNEQAAAEAVVPTEKSQSDVKPRETRSKHANEGDDSAKCMAIRTFRHSDFSGGGKDNFDEEVSRFLREIGAENVVSVTPVSYTDGDSKLEDYGVMVVFERFSSDVDEQEESVVWKD